MLPRFIKAYKQRRVTQQNLINRYWMHIHQLPERIYCFIFYRQRIFQRILLQKPVFFKEGCFHYYV